MNQAIETGAAFLLSRDPAIADYPDGLGQHAAERFLVQARTPSGYVADVLQILEALVEMGYGGDPRLAGAISWLLAKQDDRGRWRNEYAYNGKTWVDIERQGQPSKWVTLRACRVLRRLEHVRDLGSSHPEEVLRSSHAGRRRRTHTRPRRPRNRVDATRTSAS